MKTSVLKISQRTTLFMAVLVMVFSAFGTYSLVFADRFQEQINQLSAENAQKQGRIQVLEVEADSLQGAIAGLQAQINGLQQQINNNQLKSNELKDKIAEAEIELLRQRDLLGQNIKAMYLEGDISTLEMLASSSDISAFVDKQQYRNSVKDKIKTTLDKITALKLALNSQKEEVERLIKEQSTLQSQIAAQKMEQNRLLNLNQSEQAAFTQQIAENKNKIATLKKQQIEENCRRFGCGGGVQGGGGYPWGNSVCLHTGKASGPCSNYDWSVNGNAYNWLQSNVGWTGVGYGFRNCTDWVAFRVWQAHGINPAGLGNATTWDNRAPSYGYRVGPQPREGAAAISNSAYDNGDWNVPGYGHVMYVEAVYEDGRVLVSDYNRAGTGLYAQTVLSASAASSLTYVYFK